MCKKNLTLTYYGYVVPQTNNKNKNSLETKVFK